ncbi:hypothetical protein F8388_025962 [Cannabis sativa]|uniref:Uncharacterized protein n=1 Tax=Cannabis sativa TaxID=3483 RepID=A0A7J6EE86_CANSA|nr:hypothetical protein F8388_025962 [Cannabis sativa]
MIQPKLFYWRLLYCGYGVLYSAWFPIADYYNEHKKGFRELKSLKELHIYRCPELWSLPVKGLPPSFEGSLPPSFETFFGCPYLEEKYEWEGNGDLKKIRCIAQP